MDAEFLVFIFVLVEFLPTGGFRVFAEIIFINDGKLFDGGFARPDDEERGTGAGRKKAKGRGGIGGEDFLEFVFSQAKDPQVAIPYHGAIAEATAGESDGVQVFCCGRDGVCGDGSDMRFGADRGIGFDGFAESGEHVVGDGDFSAGAGFAVGALDELLQKVIGADEFLVGGAREEGDECE